MSCNFQAPYLAAPSKFSMDPKPAKINPYLALKPALIAKPEAGWGYSWQTAVPLFLSLLKQVIITLVRVLFD